MTDIQLLCFVIVMAVVYEIIERWVLNKPPAPQIKHIFRNLRR